MALSAIQARRAKQSEAPAKKRRIEVEAPAPVVPRPVTPPVQDEELPARAFSPSFPVGSDPPMEENAVPTNVTDLHFFKPQLGVNFFDLTQEESKTIHPTKSGSIAIIRPNESLHFSGSIDTVVLAGSVSIMGVDIQPSSTVHTIYAPRSHPTPSLACTPSPSTTPNASFPSRIQHLLQDGDAVVALFPTSSGIESLERTSPRFRGLFTSTRQYSSSTPGFEIEDAVTMRNPALVPDTWRNALDYISSTVSSPSPFIGLVQGPKGSGKSTFARMVVNTLASRSQPVAYLDCDLGQSEFSPPGVVSLHLITAPHFGPSFTHLRKPFCAHYVGSVTPRADPNYYLCCISALLETFATEVQYSNFIDNPDHEASNPIPLIINTQGWVKGLGADLLARITELAKPTHIFTFQRADGRVEQDVSSSAPAAVLESVQYTTVEGIAPSDPIVKLSASDLRGLSLMSYFHSRWDGDKLTWSTAQSLGSMSPWEVRCGAAIDFIALGGSEGENVIPSELENALAGGLVGLIRSDSQERRGGETGFPYTQGGELPLPTHSECLGIALVRYASSKEVDGGVLHLVTPVGGEVLARCRVLVKGDLELPATSMLDYGEDGAGDVEGPAPAEGDKAETLFGVELARVPYLHWQASAAGAGAAKRRARRNVMRRGQM